MHLKLVYITPMFQTYKIKSAKKTKLSSTVKQCLSHYILYLTKSTFIKFQSVCRTCLSSDMGPGDFGPMTSVI